MNWKASAMLWTRSSPRMTAVIFHLLSRRDDGSGRRAHHRPPPFSKVRGSPPALAARTDGCRGGAFLHWRTSSSDARGAGAAVAPALGGSSQQGPSIATLGWLWRL